MIIQPATVVNHLPSCPSCPSHPPVYNSDFHSFMAGHRLQTNHFLPISLRCLGIPNPIIKQDHDVAQDDARLW